MPKSATTGVIKTARKSLTLNMEYNQEKNKTKTFLISFQSHWLNSEDFNGTPAV